MAKSLKPLIRFTKFNVDEKRRMLTALQNREDQIIAEIHRNELQLKAEQQLAAQDVAGIGYLYGAYHKAWMQRQEMVHQALAAVRAEIETARDELSEAYRELKTYEVTQQNREKRAKEEADRKEQIFLDEVGATLHRRKEKDQEPE